MEGDTKEAVTKEIFPGVLEEQQADVYIGRINGESRAGGGNRRDNYREGHPSANTGICAEDASVAAAAAAAAVAAPAAAVVAVVAAGDEDAQSDPGGSPCLESYVRDRQCAGLATGTPERFILQRHSEQLQHEELVYSNGGYSGKSDTWEELLTRQSALYKQRDESCSSSDTSTQDTVISRHETSGLPVISNSNNDAVDKPAHLDLSAEGDNLTGSLQVDRADNDDSRLCLGQDTDRDEPHLRLPRDEFVRYLVKVDDRMMHDNSPTPEDEERFCLLPVDHSSSKVGESALGFGYEQNKDKTSNPIETPDQTTIQSIFLASADENAPLLQSGSSFGDYVQGRSREDVSIVSSSGVKYTKDEDIKDKPNIEEQVTATPKEKSIRKAKSERFGRSKSHDHEHVKNVHFLLDDTLPRQQRKYSQDSCLQKEKVRSSAPRPEITRRSSAQAVLIRHRKLTKQLSCADWEEMTRDSAIRRMSDGANLNETTWKSKGKGLFSNYQRATQVTPLNGLRQGRSLQVEVHLQRKAHTFSINLQSGAGRMPYADVRTVLLMFNPLLREKRISCNSFLYGVWGLEEVWDVERLRTESEFEDFPFYAGGRYKIKITVNKEHFAVHVDNHHLLDFHHRLSSDLISHARLEGDAYYHSTECPLCMELPFIQDIPAGLRSGHAIILDSYVWKSSQSFEIQISARQQEVYALFVTQTTFTGEITRVECNAFLNSDRRDQVTIDGHLPLHRNQDMLLKLVAEDTLFRVYVNDQHFADYEHRLPLEKLTQLSVSGDLSLYGIHVKRPPGTGLTSLRKASRCCECTLS